MQFVVFLTLAWVTSELAGASTLERTKIGSQKSVNDQASEYESIAKTQAKELADEEDMHLTEYLSNKKGKIRSFFPLFTSKSFET